MLTGKTRRGRRIIVSHACLLLVSGSQYQGNGTVIAGVLGSKTPQYCIAVAIKVDGLVTFCVMTATARANSLAAAIVIGHQIVTTIDRIAAGTDPCDW